MYVGCSWIKAYKWDGRHIVTGSYVKSLAWNHDSSEPRV
jgi:hypothetical protein